MNKRNIIFIFQSTARFIKSRKIRRIKSGEIWRTLSKQVLVGVVVLLGSRQVGSNVTFLDDTIISGLTRHRVVLFIGGVGRDGSIGRGGIFLSKFVDGCVDYIVGIASVVCEGVTVQGETNIF